MALITERYAAELQGVLTCYDRMIIQGYVAPWSHSKGMTSYLNANHIKIFDYPQFCEPLTREVRSMAERIAKEAGIEIEFIRRLKAFRKDERIQEMIESKQIRSGRGLFTFSLRWKAATRISHGMIKQVEKHF